MSKRKPKPRPERRAAAARLALERVFPLNELTGLTGETVPVLRRYGMEGRLGVYLDLVYHPEKGWCSSEEAVRRFVLALDAAKRAKSGTSSKSAGK